MYQRYSICETGGHSIPETVRNEGDEALNEAGQTKSIGLSLVQEASLAPLHVFLKFQEPSLSKLIEAPLQWLRLSASNY